MLFLCPGSADVLRKNYLPNQHPGILFEVSMKNSYYFPHDYHARHDPKLEKLRMEIGPVGDGIYWCLVEMLYEEGGYLPLSDCLLIAKALNTTEELVTKVVKNAKLFLIKDGKFYSESLLTRLNHIRIKIRKAKTSGRFGGLANAKRTLSERLANAKRTLSERLVSKEIKESKESKEEPTTEIGSLILKNKFLETLKISYPQLNIESEIRACITWHKNKGREIKSWDRAITNWVKIAYEKLGVVGTKQDNQITVRRPL